MVGREKYVFIRSKWDTAYGVTYDRCGYHFPAGGCARPPGQPDSEAIQFPMADAKCLLDNLPGNLRKGFEVVMTADNCKAKELIMFPRANDKFPPNQPDKGFPEGIPETNWSKFQLLAWMSTNDPDLIPKNPDITHPETLLALILKKHYAEKYATFERAVMAKAMRG